MEYEFVEVVNDTLPSVSGENTEPKSNDGIASRASMSIFPSLTNESAGC
jgi:hypothetical protein